MLGFLGSLIGPALGLFGGALGNRAQASANDANIAAQERINAQNIAAQEAADARNLALVKEFNASKGVDFEKLRADAAKAGFNPLTALGATGGAGYSNIPPPMGSAAMSQAAFVAPTMSLSDSISNLGMTIQDQQHALAMQGLEFDQQTVLQSAQFAHDAEMARQSLSYVMGSVGAHGGNTSAPGFNIPASGAYSGTPGDPSFSPQVDPNMVGWTYQDALNRGIGPLFAEVIPAARMIEKGFQGLGGFLWNRGVVPSLAGPRAAASWAWDSLPALSARSLPPPSRSGGSASDQAAFDAWQLAQPGYRP